MTGAQVAPTPAPAVRPLAAACALLLLLEGGRADASLPSLLPGQRRLRLRNKIDTGDEGGRRRLSTESLSKRFFPGSGIDRLQCSATQLKVQGDKTFQSANLGNLGKTFLRDSVLSR